MLLLLLSLSLLWLLCGCAAREIHAASPEDAESARSAVLLGLIDTEIEAAEQELALQRRRASALAQMLILQQTAAHEHKTNAEGAVLESYPQRTSATAQIKKVVRDSFNDSKTTLDDWFTLLQSWHAPSSAQHLELISLRANNQAAAKRGQAQSHRRGMFPGAAGSHTALLEFVLTIETGRQRSGNNEEPALLTFIHPATQEVLWQHMLDAMGPIADFYWTSDLTTYFATLSRSGRLALSKLRVMHNRRLVSGDYRRGSGYDRHQCFFKVPDSKSGFQSETNDGQGFTPVANVLLEDARPRRSAPAAGNHLHFEFETLFTRSAQQITRRDGVRQRPDKIAVVDFYHRLFVVTSDRQGSLSFYHGKNGSHIATLPNVLEGPATQLHALSMGILAVAVENRIHFVDVLDQRLLPLHCEGSTDRITSLAKDPSRHGILYAGTSKGRALAFQISHLERYSRRRKQQRQQQQNDTLSIYEDEPASASCTITAQLIPYLQIPRANADGVTQTTVKAMPGYLVLATDSNIVLYQTAQDTPPVRIAERTLLASPPDHCASSRYAAVSVVKDLGLHAVALVLHVQETDATGSSRLRLDVYESKLPAPSAGLDLGWVRVPIMLVCAVGVMLWQQNRLGQPTQRSKLDTSAIEKMIMARMQHSDWSKSDSFSQ